MSDHPQTELLSAYLDAELPDAERATLEAHVASCAECSTTLGVLRATLADLDVLPQTVEMSDAQIARLDAAVARARVEESRSRHTRFARLAWAGGGVAASIIAVAVFASTLSGNNMAKTTAEHGAQNLSGGGTAGSSVTNYTEASARDALLSFASAEGSTTFTGSYDSTVGNGAPAAVPLREATRADAQRCDKEVRSGAPEPAALIQTQFAMFKGQSATFLYYHVPSDAPKRAELWVVRPGDCYTLFFAQTPLKR
jgi:anti-sigma factor RsiW